MCEDCPDRAGLRLAQPVTCNHGRTQTLEEAMARDDVDVAIVGAGPYGLSLAAHLRAGGRDCIVVGHAMDFWRSAMPAGMCLKSEGFASNLSDPRGELTLGRYCAEHGLGYADLGVPVPLETFVSYGLEFQRRFVPDLLERTATLLTRSGDRFTLELDDGSTWRARRVVLAVGIRDFAYVPGAVAALPASLVSHSSSHADPTALAGREVVIIGAGASALDLAALAHRAGADVTVVTRGPGVHFHDKMRLPRRLHERILAPTSGVGPGWRSRFYTDAAPVFHRLPERVRVGTVRRSLGPVGCWFVRDDVVGKVEVVASSTIVGARAEADRVALSLRGPEGSVSELVADHVVAATGYRVDLARLSLLAPSLAARISLAERTPALSDHFESSVGGLYFVGATAANSFGPMLRFAYGAAFASRRVARHLART